MNKNIPTEIQYCLPSGAILRKFPFPVLEGTSYFYCEALVKKCLNTYWGVEGGALFPMHKSPKSNPLPELIRVVAEDGSIFCQLSIDEMPRIGPMARG